MRVAIARGQIPWKSGLRRWHAQSECHESEEKTEGARAQTAADPMEADRAENQEIQIERSRKDGLDSDEESPAC